jgi:RNase H-fold protein (predicted Holliday junction resolvase)
MAFLAIDYGTQRVGLAMSQFGFAEPVRVIATDQTLREVQNLLQTQEIEGIVVGMPDGVMQEKVHELIQQLKKETDRTIFIVEETFSSQEIYKDMLASGATAHDRAQPIDHYVAAKLLQTFLDTHPSLRKEAV